MPMSDIELAAFCGFTPEDDQEKALRYVRGLSPEKRELFERMKQVEMWDATDGLVPLPTGVIVCHEHKHR